MAIWLREDTAVTIVLGPFVDPTTPADEETTLTINQAAVRLSKNGGAFAQKSDATAATHMENGFYSCPLNATDTSTPGSLVVAVADTNALIWWKEYHVVPQQVWDSYLSTDRLQVHAAEISNDLITAAAIANGAIDAATFAAGAIDAAALATDAITAAKIADGAIDAGTFAANSITASALAADAVAEIADGVWDEDIDAAHQTANTAGKRLDDASTTVATNLDATVSSRSTFDDTTDKVLINDTTQAQIDSIESSFSGVGISFVTTGSPTTTSVNISGANLGDVTGDHNRQYCFFTSGAQGVIGVGRWITTYTFVSEGNGTLAFSGGATDPDGPLPVAPSAGVSGRILGRR